MARVHVAMNDTNFIVERSVNSLKDRLRSFPETQWETKTYVVPTDSTSVVKMLESPREFLNTLQAESNHSVRVNAQGQVRNS